MEATPTSTALPSQTPSEYLVEKDVAVSRTQSSDSHPSTRLEAKNEKDIAFTSDEKAVEPQTQANEPDYPSGIKLATIMIAICLAVFLVALDNTIIATAIPRITDQFKSLDDVGWYAYAYLLTTCAFQLLFGKFYTFFSIKWVFLLTIGIFEVGSLVCGVSPNSTSLIVGRAIAGLGSAGIFSGGLIIIAYSVPLQKRPIYTGLIGGMYGIASVAGPLMGGAFTDHLTWRWCFYINLPIGAVTFLIIAVFFKSPAREKEASIGFSERFKQFDPIGTLVFIPAVVCLLLALQWGGTKYPWSSGRIIALFVMFGLLIITFVGVQFWKGETATVPPRILNQRSMLGASWFAICLGGAFFLFIYYLPIWFQAIKGVSATESGIRNLPLILAQVIMSVGSGVLISKFGYYTPFMYGSVVFMSVGAALLTTLKVDSGHAMWIGYQVIFGSGTGLGFQQPIIAAQTVLSLDDIPIGTATLLFIQLLGGALFVSVGNNIFTNTLVTNLKAAVPNLNANDIIQAGATNLKNTVDAKSITAVLTAYNGALTKTFQISLVLGCLSVFGAAVMEWKSVKGKSIEAAGA